MSGNQSPVEKPSVIRLDIDGEQHRLAFIQSSKAAELRKKISERHKISTNTCFLDADDCRVHIEDEESITVKELLIEKNSIRLITDESKLTPITVPDEKNKLSERKTDLTYVQTFSQSPTKTALPEIKMPGSTPTRLENKIILATDLVLDMWQKIFHNCNLLRGIKMHEAIPKRAFKSILKFKESTGDFPLFQVNDSSYTRAYIHDEQMENSFLLSLFLNGGIEFSNFSSGFGINPEYAKVKTSTNVQRKIHLTYCFNFPRVTLKLDSSYLEPTPEFIKDIDNVISTFPRNEQANKLKEVLSTYGHVYPGEVILGGQLYHTEEHNTKEEAEEAKQRISVETSLSALIIKPAKSCGGGGGYDNQSQNKSSEQTSLLTFKAIGGDTLNNRDPTLWANTVADPFLWRVIEEDYFQSVIKLLDKERQQKLEKVISYSKIMDAKWKQHGTPVAGGNGRGTEVNQLFIPVGMCIDDNQTIYIADYWNNWIVEWKSNKENTRIVAGGNGYGKKTNQLHGPIDVIIDKQNNSFIISDSYNRRIMRWPRQNNQNGQIIIKDIDCRGLAMDNNGDLYVADSEKNEVRLWKIGEKNGKLVAGGHGKGAGLNQLNNPAYIFIDEDYSLYISDRDNHRVMKWIKGGEEGAVVAGGNGEGNWLSQFSYPHGVVVDQCGRIYVTDRENHRVMRWIEGAAEGSIVVGGNGEGRKSDQLHRPISLSFDRHGNLYVVDGENQRVQRFDIN